jgi:hypothetical protein
MGIGFTMSDPLRRSGLVQRPAGWSTPILIAAFTLGIPRWARAEDSATYKYEDYREAAGRISVTTQVGSFQQDLGTDTHLGLTGTVDAISGATPTGAPAPAGSDQVVLTEMHERRKAWSGDLSHQFGPVNIDAGFANSRESDYVSWGWSINTLTDFNQKNTTLRLGLAGTDDRVEVFFEPAYLPKHTHDVIAGVTQLIDPLTAVTVNLSLGWASGYLSEQRKLVQKTVEVIPGVFLTEDFGENRPNHRQKQSLYASLNRSVPSLKGAAEASYRLYHDTFGVTSSTVELAWFQHLGSHLVLSPSARYYTQTAARFYIYNLDTTSIVPVPVPLGTGALYSSDFRLSRLDTTSLGLKLSWTPVHRLELDLAFDDYRMRGRDGVTPASAYPRAAVTTAGATFLW